MRVRTVGLCLAMLVAFVVLVAAEEVSLSVVQEATPAVKVQRVEVRKVEMRTRAGVERRVSGGGFGGPAAFAIYPEFDGGLEEVFDVKVAGYNSIGAGFGGYGYSIIGNLLIGGGGMGVDVEATIRGSTAEYSGEIGMGFMMAGYNADLLKLHLCPYVGFGGFSTTLYRVPEGFSREDLASPRGYACLEIGGPVGIIGLDITVPIAGFVRIGMGAFAYGTLPMKTCLKAVPKSIPVKGIDDTVAYGYGFKVGMLFGGYRKGRR